MASFLEALRSGRVLLMDGAMGTELQRAGIGENDCYEAWNLMHPDKVRSIHQAYVDAGAEVLLTNTFQANISNLTKHGIRDELGNVVRAGFGLAHQAAGSHRFVLASIGPMGTEQPKSWRGWLHEMPPFSCWPDAILFETYSDVDELSRALAHWYDCTLTPISLNPFLVSIAYIREPNGFIHSLDGKEPEFFAEQTERQFIWAIGVNCGRDIGMDEIIEIVRRYRQETDLPLFARPNAGTPKRVGDRWVYPLTPEKMAERLPELLEEGVSMVGGCCGTTPEHIAAMRPIVDAWNAKRGFPPTQV